jgi:hypothetical protein
MLSCRVPPAGVLQVKMHMAETFRKYIHGLHRGGWLSHHLSSDIKAWVRDFQEESHTARVGIRRESPSCRHAPTHGRHRELSSYPLPELEALEYQWKITAGGTSLSPRTQGLHKLPTAQPACPKMKVAERFRLASLSGSCWRPVWLCYTSNQRGGRAGQGVRHNILSAGDMPDVRGVFIQVTQLPRLS